MNYQPTYLGEISLDEDTLTHYGVKGMRWRRRRGKKKQDLSVKAKKVINIKRTNKLSNDPDESNRFRAEYAYAMAHPGQAKRYDEQAKNARTIAERNALTNARINSTDIGYDHDYVNGKQIIRKRKAYKR